MQRQGTEAPSAPVQEKEKAALAAGQAPEPCALLAVLAVQADRDWLERRLLRQNSDGGGATTDNTGVFHSFGAAGGTDSAAGTYNCVAVIPRQVRLHGAHLVYDWQDAEVDRPRLPPARLTSIAVRGSCSIIIKHYKSPQITQRFCYRKLQSEMFGN